jgi:hypothetical protein
MWLDPAAVSLLLASLEDVRADSVTSRDMQQRAIAWYGTVLASVVFGGLVYAGAFQTTPGVGSPDPWVLIVLYGVAGPAIAVITTVVYLGELKRQARAALIWRSIEYHISQDNRWQLPIAGRHLPPLFVESTLARLGRDRVTHGYGVAAYYLAMLALFGGGVVVSLLIGWSLVRMHQPSVTLAGATVSVYLVCAVVTLVTWLLLTYWMSSSVRQLASRRLDLTI